MKAQLLALARNKRVQILGASLLSAGASGGITYHFTHKHLRLKYEQIAEQEIAAAKEYYSAMNKTGDYSSPAKVAEMKGYPVAMDTHPALNVVEEGTDEEKELIAEGDKLASELGYTEPQVKTIEKATLVSVSLDAEPGPHGGTVELVEDEIPEDAVITKNVFKDAKSANSFFDYDEEVPLRQPDKPYIITEEEFDQNEPDFISTSLTYYEEDGILADEQDVPIEDSDRMVGDANLMRFGHGAKNRDKLYIRNEVLDLNFDITRSTGSFAREVHNFQGSLEHSERRPRHQRHWRDDG
jgi:hypothetical protein